MFEFKILAKQKKTKARVGEFTTPHGKFLTPELAFVATDAELKSIPKKVINKLPAKLIIVNTFHILSKKILAKIEKVGGVHKYMDFQKPIMSDSGGFQAFSLGFSLIHGVGKVASMFPDEIRKNRIDRIKSDRPDISDLSDFSDLSDLSDVSDLSDLSDSNNPLIINERGVEFTYNEEKILLTPEKSMQIQQKIGADIIYAFDECTSPLNTKRYTEKAMERTHRWLKRCLKTKISNKQALFGIVQGGYYEDLRKKSAKFVGKQDVPGFGIGGSLGTTKDEVRSVLEWTIKYLPGDKPRHLLGIGKVRDIFEGVERGVDTFDCVIPTREARHKVLYTDNGRVNLKKMKTVNELIDKKCKCETCTNNVTMQQLYQFFLKKDPRAFYFATVHNIQFYADLMKKIRNSIEDGKFFELKERYFKCYY